MTQSHGEIAPNPLLETCSRENFETFETCYIYLCYNTPWQAVFFASISSATECALCGGA